MKAHKNKIIAAVVIIIVLAAAWLYGGAYPGSGGIAADQPGANGSGAEGVTPVTTEPARPHDTTETPESAEPAGTDTPESAEPAAAETTESAEPAAVDTTESAEPAAAETTVSTTPGTTEPSSEPAQTDADTLSEAIQTDADMPSEAIQTDTDTPSDPQKTDDDTLAATGGNTSAARDRYLTDPVPEGKPEPVEPEDATVGDDSFTVYLTIRTDAILGNMGLLDREKHELVPADGVIMPMTAVTAYEGESVFNILQRETRRHKVHMVSRFTPIYNSAYIEAINNLYEFDVGELSGWMYKVNGWFPNYGSSRYLLQPDDIVEWHFTCELGRDLGEYRLGGLQRDD